jgi:hypothetical protein
MHWSIILHACSLGCDTPPWSGQAPEGHDLFLVGLREIFPVQDVYTVSHLLCALLLMRSDAWMTEWGMAPAGTEHWCPVPDQATETMWTDFLYASRANQDKPYRDAHCLMLRVSVPHLVRLQAALAGRRLQVHSLDTQGDTECTDIVWQKLMRLQPSAEESWHRPVAMGQHKWLQFNRDWAGGAWLDLPSMTCWEDTVHPASKQSQQLHKRVWRLHAHAAEDRPYAGLLYAHYSTRTTSFTHLQTFSLTLWWEPQHPDRRAWMPAQNVVTEPIHDGMVMYEGTLITSHMGRRVYRMPNDVLNSPVADNTSDSMVSFS